MYKPKIKSTFSKFIQVKEEIKNKNVFLWIVLLKKGFRKHMTNISKGNGYLLKRFMTLYS